MPLFHVLFFPLLTSSIWTQTSEPVSVGPAHNSPGFLLFTWSTAGLCGCLCLAWGGLPAMGWEAFLTTQLGHSVTVKSSLI